MWRYVAIPENKKICYFLYFFGCGAVAICGDTPKIKKKQCFLKFFS